MPLIDAERPQRHSSGDQRCCHRPASSADGQNAPCSEEGHPCARDRSTHEDRLLWPQACELDRKCRRCQHDRGRPGRGEHHRDSRPEHRRKREDRQDEQREAPESPDVAGPPGSQERRTYARRGNSTRPSSPADSASGLRSPRRRSESAASRGMRAEVSAAHQSSMSEMSLIPKRGDTSQTAKISSPVAAAAAVIGTALGWPAVARNRSITLLVSSRRPSLFTIAARAGPDRSGRTRRCAAGLREHQRDLGQHLGRVHEESEGRPSLVIQDDTR